MERDTFSVCVCIYILCVFKASHTETHSHKLKISIPSLFCLDIRTSNMAGVRHTTWAIIKFFGWPIPYRWQWFMIILFAIPLPSSWPSLRYIALSLPLRLLLGVGGSSGGGGGADDESSYHCIHVWMYSELGQVPLSIEYTVIPFNSVIVVYILHAAAQIPHHTLSISVWSSTSIFCWFSLVPSFFSLCYVRHSHMIKMICIHFISRSAIPFVALIFFSFFLRW